ncbi:MAG: hypothetical protein IJD21_09520 [Oscillospiraceae bacterium]|nr:hypothetical protein [Oscillospiraceae bacterium]
MKKTLRALIPLFLGLICGLFRRTIWSVTYDPATQLITEPELPGLSHGLMVVSVLIVVLLVIKNWPEGREMASPYPARTPFHRICRLAAGGIGLVSGLMMGAEQLSHQPLALIALLMCLFQTAAGGSMVLMGLDRKAKGKNYSTLLLVPSFCCCYWMVAFYHVFGSHPHAETYLYPILAGILVMFCWIFYAGFHFRPGESRKFALAWALLMLVMPSALTAPLTIPYQLSLLAQLVWFLPVMI